MGSLTSSQPRRRAALRIAVVVGTGILIVLSPAYFAPLGILLVLPLDMAAWVLLGIAGKAEQRPGRNHG